MQPTLDAGPPMKVTYRIKPEAVWSDGEPITSKDFEYTWKQIVTGKDIYDTTGYDDIASVDTTDPKTAVVTFKKPFAGWQDLFGGFYFVLPSHLLEGKNRSKAMKDGYAFSGGPWKLDGRQERLEEGQEHHARAEPEVLGHQAVDRQGRSSSSSRRARPSSRRVKTGQVSRPTRCRIDGALDQLDESTNLTYHGRLREPVRGVLAQRRRRSRSTARRCARRSSTRPTGRRSSTRSSSPRSARARAAELHRPDVQAVLQAGVRASTRRTRRWSTSS